jgi:RHS repeat-associated protein
LKSYAYDDAFRITGIADALDPNLSWSYGYDVLDRLTGASSAALTQGWTYDANGNRLTETGATPSTYAVSPASNRVSSIAGSLPRTYAYDAAGNTLSYASATFTYDNRGRMATAANGGVTAAYTYNALGQRVQRSASGVSTLYVYDEAGHLVGEYSATGVLIQETVWLGDTPIATLRPDGSGGVVVFYVHADHLNTPRLITDTANNLRWSWESDPFGTNLPDQDPSSTSTFEYNLRFPGQQFDGIVGLHYNYFRDFDPAVGRYIESDPIGLNGGRNTYVYVLGNPVSNYDALGLKTCQGRWIKFGEQVLEIPTRRGNIPAWTCTCYWMCINCTDSGIMWDGNIFGLPSSKGVTYVDYSGNRSTDAGTGGTGAPRPPKPPAPNGPKGRSGAMGGAYGCLCAKPGPDTGCTKCYRGSILPDYMK